MRYLTWLVLLSVAALGQPYDLLLRGGHVIDPKNGVDQIRDVAIAGGKVAKVALGIPAKESKVVADVEGLYVTPGLIDMHVHVYAGTGVKALAGDQSVYPDGFSFRTGVTTMVDAGTAGWRNFPDFRQRVIERARTRVLAFVNIVADGMSPAGENDPGLMNAAEAARVAKENPGIVVGYKSAHYSAQGWPSIDRSVEAGKLAGLPVMVDFGYIDKDRNLDVLLGDKLRKGDIYTHCYSGHRDELLAGGKLNPAMLRGRQRGILFDVGHGGGSFYWNVAVPALEQGFKPDVISTDLHTGSMNAGMKDLPNVMSKLLNLGVPLGEVIRAVTWTPATSIQHPELGHLSEGAEADVTVLALERGSFGFLDSAGARFTGTRRILPQLTLRKGVVVWDLEGRSTVDWRRFPYKPRASRP